jgi:hypothetical protein
VLIYVLYAERAVEIVADRGFNGLVSEPEWSAVCHAMQREFSAGRWAEGAIGVYNVDSGERLANLRVAPHATDMVWVDGGLPAGSAAAGEGLAEVKARIFVAAANTATRGIARRSGATVRWPSTTSSPRVSGCVTRATPARDDSPFRAARTGVSWSAPA